VLEFGRLVLVGMEAAQSCQNANILSLGVPPSGAMTTTPYSEESGKIES
jgi:hypothetical protein